MKKVLALLMVVVFCVSLCACGGEKKGDSMTNEEMLSQAKEVTIEEIVAATEENVVRAETLYEGIVKIENFKVQYINSYTDNASIEWIYLDSSNSAFTIDAKISKEDAAMLSVGDTVTVVGRLDIGSLGFSANIYSAFIVR